MKALDETTLAEADHPLLYRLVRDLAALAELPMPQIGLLRLRRANVCSNGRGPRKAVILISPAAIELLSIEELRGVIAHELAHVRNRDLLVQVCAGIAGIVALDLVLAALWLSSDNMTLRVAGSLGLIALSSIGVGLGLSAIARRQEFLADRFAVSICGEPEALAGALTALDKAAPGNQAKLGPLSRLFLTHPPVDERIFRLQQTKLAT